MQKYKNQFGTNNVTMTLKNFSFIKLFSLMRYILSALVDITYFLLEFVYTRQTKYIQKLVFSYLLRQKKLKRPLFIVILIHLSTTYRKWDKTGLPRAYEIFFEIIQPNSRTHLFCVGINLQVTKDKLIVCSYGFYNFVYCRNVFTWSLLRYMQSNKIQK